jgi:hypothetical protein
MSSSAEIYLVTNSVDDDWYVGRTRIGASNRFRGHRSASSKCPKLRDKIQQLGPDAFTVHILESGMADPHEAELRWYHHYLDRGIGRTLNSCEPGRWTEPTPERNAKIGVAHRGRVLSDDHKTKISIARSGHTNSPEARARMSASHVGLHPSDETRAKLSKASMGNQKTKGRSRTPEERARISASLKARHTHAQTD